MSEKYWLDDKGMPHKIGAEISLRDWFAGQMLVGMKLSSVTGREQWFAETAYAMADAMLAAREPKKEG